jgi:hypothetical protein
LSGKGGAILRKHPAIASLNIDWYQLVEKNQFAETLHFHTKQQVAPNLISVMFWLS